MPFRFYMFERRDNADRTAIANNALALCRAIRETNGINSAKFYWSGLDHIALLIDGENTALNAPGSGNPNQAAKAAFDLSDVTRQTMDIRLAEPRLGEEAYRSAGR